MDKYEIAVLAEDYENKRMVWQCHQMANTPTDWDERQKSLIAMHVAEAEMIEAWKKLEQAKLGIK